MWKRSSGTILSKGISCKLSIQRGVGGIQCIASGALRLATASNQSYNRNLEMFAKRPYADACSQSKYIPAFMLSNLEAPSLEPSQT